MPTWIYNWKNLKRSRPLFQFTDLFYLHSRALHSHASLTVHCPHAVREASRGDYHAFKGVQLSRPPSVAPHIKTKVFCLQYWGLVISSVTPLDLLLQLWLRTQASLAGAIFPSFCKHSNALIGMTSILNKFSLISRSCVVCIIKLFLQLTEHYLVDTQSSRYSSILHLAITSDRAAFMHPVDILEREDKK